MRIPKQRKIQNDTKRLALPLVSVLCDGTKPLAERQIAVESLAEFRVTLKSVLPAGPRRACLPALQRCLEDRSKNVDPYYALSVLQCLDFPAEDLRQSMGLGRTISTVRSCCDLGGRLATVAKQVLETLEGSLSEDRPAPNTSAAGRTPPATGGQGAALQVTQAAGGSRGSLAISNEHNPTETQETFDRPRPGTQESLPDSSTPVLVPIVRAKGASAGDKLLAAQEGWQVCTKCHKLCQQPHTAETLLCSICIQPVHQHCRKPNQPLSHLDGGVGHSDRRIICSKGCKDVQTGFHRMVEESRSGGAIRLAAPYPPGFAVTITEGADSSANSQTDHILPAAIKLLPTFASDYRDLGIYGITKLVPAFVYREHPDWRYNQAHTAVLYTGVPSEGFIDLKECKAVSTVIFRVQGPDLVDLLYAGTDQELWGCKLLQVLMSFLQVKWKEIGVMRIFLDAADKTACRVWKSPSLGFTAIDEATFLGLHRQYKLLHNVRQNGLERCIKLLPPIADLHDELRWIASKVPKDLEEMRQRNIASHAAEQRKLQQERAACAAQAAKVQAATAVVGKRQRTPSHKQLCLEQDLQENKLRSRKSLRS